MRKRRIRTAGDNRLECRSLEPRAANLPVDVERNVAFGPTAADEIGHARRDRRQPTGGFGQDCELVAVLVDASPFDKPFRRDQRRGLFGDPDRLHQPVVPADGEMRGLEADSRRRHGADRRRKCRVVRRLHGQENQTRTLVGGAARAGNCRDVPRIGDEQKAVGGHHHDRRAPGEVGEIENIRQRCHHQRIEGALGHRAANCPVPLAK